MKLAKYTFLIFALHTALWIGGWAIAVTEETFLTDGVKTKAIITTAVGEQNARQAFANFKAQLGPDNGDMRGPIFPGSRSIDWDGAAVPFDMPGNFFRDNATRGSLVRVDGDQFRVSNPVLETDPGLGDNLFDTFNPDYPNQFKAFSGARIFSPLSDNVFSLDFSVPGSSVNVPASITDFGAIFVDVDITGESWMEFHNLGGRSLGRILVPPAPQDFTFVGVQFQPDIEFGVVEILSITFQLGNAVLGADDIPGEQDVVVLDDLVYNEPTPIITK